MHILSITVRDFRNLVYVRLEPDPRLNVLLGDNAQGKTNFLDAIWFLSGCKSFHGLKEKQLVNFNAEALLVSVEFWDGRRIQTIEYAMTRQDCRRKRIVINGAAESDARRLFEIFHCVAFSPNDVEIITGAPEMRRTFLDLCSCQINTSGMDCVRRAAKSNMQRNAAIQEIIRRKGPGCWNHLTKEDLDAVSMWNTNLAVTTAYVSCMRYEYVQMLAPLCRQLYTQLTGGAEKLELVYKSSVFGFQPLPSRPTQDEILACHDFLIEEAPEDIKVGYTRKGIQRDDLLIAIDGRPAGVYGSQGQKKSAALVLRLAQAHLYRKATRRTPIVLLDDVMGELDERRQAMVYSMVSDMQVFATLCQPSALLSRENPKVFHVSGGQIC